MRMQNDLLRITYVSLNPCAQSSFNKIVRRSRDPPAFKRNAEEHSSKPDLVCPQGLLASIYIIIKFSFEYPGFLR